MNPWLEEKELFSIVNTINDFYESLKFMTFKIKQRAIKDYDRYRGHAWLLNVENEL